MKRHQVGIIGCGWVAPFHVKALNQMTDRAEIRWVADPEIERARNIAKTIRGGELVEALADYRQALTRADAVFILVPHHLHHPITMAALNAGCHVLLEKPFANSLSAADEMIAKSEEKQRTLMIAYPHRYRKSTQKLKELIDSGVYGKLFMLDAMMDEDQRAYISGWLAKKATLGGGVFFSASPHMLDVMLWIAGEVSTISMVGTRGGLNMEGEDTALSVMKFKNGIVGTTRHTWFSPKPEKWYTLRAFCERAILTLTINPLGDLAQEGDRCAWKSTIEVSGCANEVLLDTGEGLDFTEEVAHFFDCVETGKPAQTDGKTARKLMEVVFRAYQKAEQEGGL